MVHRVSVALLAAVLAVTVASCAHAKPPARQPTAAVPGASLWERPADLASRDLFYGPWGAERAPDPRATYTLVELKHSGINPGMTVRDPQGREWSVKQTPPGGYESEGQVEVAVSRLLSAVGYHQPPVYYVPSFTLKDDWGTKPTVGGRFRLKEPTLKDTGAWSWQENPFVGTKPYQGLLVLMMMFNATDLKNSNNTLYEQRQGDLIRQLYVARDVGAALGDSDPLAPRKGHPAAFERYPFIQGVSDGHVTFAYNGWYRNLVRDRITPDDVRWAADLLGQLSAPQWRDAFRAAGYDTTAADVFIRKLHEKIAQGRTIGGRAAAE